MAASERTSTVFSSLEKSSNLDMYGPHSNRPVPLIVSECITCMVCEKWQPAEKPIETVVLGSAFRQVEPSIFLILLSQYRSSEPKGDNTENHMWFDLVNLTPRSSPSKKTLCKS